QESFAPQRVIEVLQDGAHPGSLGSCQGDIDVQHLEGDVVGFGLAVVTRQIVGDEAAAISSRFKQLQAHACGQFKLAGAESGVLEAANPVRSKVLLKVRTGLK